MELSGKTLLKAAIAFAAIVLIILITNKNTIRFNTIADTGTTLHIQQIFMERCRNYQTFNVEQLTLSSWVKKNCTKLWETFLQSFQKRTPCNVIPDDYSQYFIDASPGMTPRNKAMFWSGRREIAHDHDQSYINNNYITLEDSFPGYITSDLIWCQNSDNTGFNFTYCPKYKGECTQRNSAPYAYWIAASKQFASHAQGIAYLMVDGPTASKSSAYNSESFFASVELPSLNTSLIDELKVYIVLDQNNSEPKQKCGKLTMLMRDIEAMGIMATCEDNSEITLSILCDKYPEINQCIALTEEKYYLGDQVKPLGLKRLRLVTKMPFIVSMGILVSILLALAVRSCRCLPYWSCRCIPY